MPGAALPGLLSLKRKTKTSFTCQRRRPTDRGRSVREHVDPSYEKLATSCLERTTRPGVKASESFARELKLITGRIIEASDSPNQ